MSDYNNTVKLYLDLYYKYNNITEKKYISNVMKK